MFFPFEFRECLLTSELLDHLGFSEYHDGCGDFGHRFLMLGENKYVIYEHDELIYGDGLSNDYIASHILNKNFESLYFLHEMYEDIVKLFTYSGQKKFLKLCENKRVNRYLVSYLNYKHEI